MYKHFHTHKLHAVKQCPPQHGVPPTQADRRSLNIFTTVKPKAGCVASFKSKLLSMQPIALKSSAALSVVLEHAAVTGGSAVSASVGSPIV